MSRIIYYKRLVTGLAIFGNATNYNVFIIFESAKHSFLLYNSIAKLLVDWQTTHQKHL